MGLKSPAVDPERDITRKQLIDSIIAIVPTFTVEQVDSYNFFNCLSCAALSIVEHGLFGHNELANHARNIQQGLRQITRDGGIA